MKATGLCGRGRLPAIVAGAALVLVAASIAAAHSVLEGSFPSANASLPTPPREVTLRFSEAVDKLFSSAAVLDRNGRQVSRQVSLSRGGRELTVVLIDLTSGVYTVRWRVLSSIDGHTTSGFFFIAVGQRVPSGMASTGAAETPPPPLVAIRWIALTAAMLAVGTAFYQYLVVRPGMAALEHDVSRLRGAIQRALRLLTVVSVLVLLLALAAEFVLQVVTLLGASLAGLFAGGALWSFLGGTKAGWSVIVQGSMAAILLLPHSPAGRILRASALIWFLIVGTVTAVLGGPAALGGSTHAALIVLVASVYGLLSALLALILPLVLDLRLPEGNWVPPAAGAVLLAGITLSSHAAGIGPLAIVIDWVHLLAAAAWIGGLAAFLLTLRAAAPSGRPDLARVLVPKVSTLAAISLGGLIVTGLYSAWVHIPAVEAFVVTAYGRTLMVKILLVAFLAALGALNRFVFRPRLERSGAGVSTLHRFQRSMGAEVILGAAVFLIVSVLTITPPATVTMPQVAGPPLLLAGEADDLQVALTVAPATVGWNRFEVTAKDRAGRPLAEDARVLLRFTKLDEDLDPTTIVLGRVEDGKYAAEGSQLGLAGWWEAEVIVRLRGKLDATTSFPVRVGKPSLRTSDPEALQLLDKTKQAMRVVGTWRELQQIADGAGGAVVTQYEIVRPDRLRYRSSSGQEVVVIGTTRYARDGSSGPWQKDSVLQPLKLDGPYMEYLAGAGQAIRGRQDRCDDSPCRVVLWQAQGGSAAFAGWIDLHTARMRRIMMIAPAHYMTDWLLEYNLPLEITPP